MVERELKGLKPGTLKSGAEPDRRHQSLARLSFQTMLAEERERRYIATEVHDEIVKDLVYCNLRLGMLSRRETGLLNDSLEEVQSHVRELIEKVRFLISEISPPLLYDLGLEVAVRQFLKDVQHKHGIACHIDENEPGKLLAEDIRIFLFLSVRELVTNAVRHARAENIRVSIVRRENHMEVTVEDDGIGFDVLAIFGDDAPLRGAGLVNIRERLRCLGGYLNVQSQPDNGSRVTAILPARHLQSNYRQA